MDLLGRFDPKELGPFVLKGLIGSGGMGRVFLGVHRYAHTQAAIKTLQLHLLDNSKLIDRFRREILALQRIERSPFVAPIVDADINGERPWFATEYVKGTPLEEAIRLAGCLDEAASRRLAAYLCCGLQAIHRAGVIHRDIKPTNVILTSDGRPVIIDFGIAYLLNEEGITDGGDGPGTPGYVSPERLVHGDTTTAADIFSFGAVIAYAAQGFPPFAGQTVTKIQMDVVREEPILSRDRIPPSLFPLIEQCLAKDPLDRPSLIEIAQALGVSTDEAQGTGWLPKPVKEDIHNRTTEPGFHSQKTETSPRRRQAAAAGYTPTDPDPTPAPPPAPQPAPAPAPVPEPESDPEYPWPSAGNVKGNPKRPLGDPDPIPVKPNVVEDLSWIPDDFFDEDESTGTSGSTTVAPQANHRRPANNQPMSLGKAALIPLSLVLLVGGATYLVRNAQDNKSHAIAHVNPNDLSAASQVAPPAAIFHPSGKGSTSTEPGSPDPVNVTVKGGIQHGYTYEIVVHVDNAHPSTDTDQLVRQGCVVVDGPDGHHKIAVANKSLPTHHDTTLDGRIVIPIIYNGDYTYKDHCGTKSDPATGVNIGRNELKNIGLASYQDHTVVVLKSVLYGQDPDNQDLRINVAEAAAWNQALDPRDLEQTCLKVSHRTPFHADISPETSDENLYVGHMEFNGATKGDFFATCSRSDDTNPYHGTSITLPQ